MAHAGHVARADGRISFDRLERAALPVVPSWIPPGLSEDDYATALVGNRLKAPTCWPFRQDCPLGDFAVTDGPKWWTHGLVHALVGTAYWGGMSEWEIAHMARLDEAVASWHWYWLSELDRRYCDVHSVTTADQTPDCDHCRALEAATHQRATRLERLAAPQAQAVANNSLAFLRYEAHCFDHGISTGELVVPEGPYLSMGEACDYARLHGRRLVSPSHVRWLEACLEPGVDYATGLAEFSARAASVCRALIAPISPPASVAAPRARRVLQDLGARLCHGAALTGDPTSGFDGGLLALRDGLTAVGQADDDGAVEQALGQALEGVVAALSAAGELAERILAVGYRPTARPETEPAAMRAARIGALRQRAQAVRAPVTPILSRLPALCEAVIDAPRSADLTHDTARAAESRATESTDDALISGFTGWLTLASQHWGPEYAAPFRPTQWTYRLALPALPPKETWDAVRIRPNPYLTTLPCPFDVNWLDQLTTNALPEDYALVPRPAGGVGYALLGQGRSYPLLIACTSHRQDLLNRLQHTPTIGELIASGVTEDALSHALDEELVIALHQRTPVTLQVSAADGQGIAVTEDVPIGAGCEDPGPWQAPDQAAYYADYCDRTSLYTDLAEALVRAANVGESDTVVDLGCGTGVSTAALLEAVGPEGAVVAIDPAPRMLELAREAIVDPRVRFETGTARRLVQIGGPFDRVVSNSAIWLDPNILVPWKAAQLVLNPGGCLAFSLPAEFLGHTEHWSTSSGQALATTLQHIRRELIPDTEPTEPVTPTPHPDYLGTVERLTDVLNELGFTTVDTTLHVHEWTIGDYLDWMGQPVSLATLCPGNTAQQTAFIQRLRADLDLDAVVESRWFLVVATT